MLCHKRWVFVDDAVHELREAPVVKRVVSRQAFVHDDAEGEEIGLMGDRIVLHLLGRHVTGGARELHSRGGRSGAALQAGDAEIADLGLTVLREQDVRGLDVAVDHPLAVGILQRTRRLEGGLDDPLDGQEVIRLHVGLEGGAVAHVFHDDVTAITVHARIEDLHDVRVPQASCGLRLTEKPTAKPLGQIAAVGEALEGHLEGDRPIDVGIVALIDDGRGAAADLTQDLVFAESRMLGRCAPCGLAHRGSHSRSPGSRHDG